jgi:hypothetical protein
MNPSGDDIKDMLQPWDGDGQSAIQALAAQSADLLAVHEAV